MWAYKLYKHIRHIRAQNYKRVYKDLYYCLQLQVFCIVGFPPVADLAQLVLSWKPRQSGSTSSVYCQTTISGNIESCMPSSDSSQPVQQSQQQKKKPRRTVVECLKQREAKAVTSSSCLTENCNSVLTSPAAGTEADQLTTVSTSQAVSTSHVHEESSLPLLVEPDVRSTNSIAVQRSQSPLMPVMSATVCQPQIVDNSHSVTSPAELTTVLPVLTSEQHPVAISEVSIHTVSKPSSVNTLPACCSRTTDASSATVRSSRAVLLLPSSTQQCPAVVPTTAIPTYRVTERVTSGTVLVDMDIGSNVLGSGLMCGTFVYHGGRLVLGQQRHNNTAVSLLPEVNACHAPVYFLAGSRPVVAPSPNVYAVTVPSEALLNGLRVVCNGVSNVVDDSQLPVNASDTDLHANLANTSATDGTNRPLTAMQSSQMSQESSRTNAMQKNTNRSHTGNMLDVAVMGSSETEAEHRNEEVNGSKSCFPTPSPVVPTISIAESHQGSADAGRTSAEPCQLADESSNIVVHSSSSQAVASVLASGMHVTDIRSSPAASNNIVTNTRLVEQVTGSVTSQLSTALHSCADVQASSSSSFVSSDLQPDDCIVSSELSSGERTEIPPAATSKQQQGVKRKLASQSADECSSKTKISRMESEKRISKYICPPPDSASDKDSEIIHVMDRFCDRSLERYFCPVSDCTATSQHLAMDLFQSTSEDHGSMVNVLPGTAAHGCNSSWKYPAGLSTSCVSSAMEPSNLNHEQAQTATQFSTSLSTKSLCSEQSQASHVHLLESSSRVDSVPTSHGKGFALANFLSSNTTPNMLVLSQQSSLLESPQMSKSNQSDKSGNALPMEPIQTQNQTFIPVNKTSAINCDSASNILPDDLSLTDNDFAMILSDTDDSSMFSIPSRKSVDSNYWNLGFGSMCGRIRDRTKDGSGIEPSLHTSIEDFYHSILPMFTEQNCVPETDYVISDHVDPGSKVGFNVSSLTCKTTSVCRTSSSTQIADSFSSSMSVNIPPRYSLVSQRNEASLDHTTLNKLKEVSPTQASNVMCSAVQSSTRGIFSLAHHAVQPVSKSLVPNLSSSEVAQSASVLWSPCNGAVHKSSLSSDSMSEHRRSLNIGRQCRLPSSAISDVHWRMPEPSNFGPLYNSWSDNLYCTVQSLARPRPLVDQRVNAQPEACNMQSVFNRPKLYSVPEMNNEKFHGRYSDDDFCPFVSSKSKPAASKHVPPNCQFSSHRKVPDSSSSQPLWTYSECDIPPQSYLSTSRGWLPTNNSDTSTSITFDLSLSVAATSCRPASTCRLPSFSFATVPPVPDFLSLSFASTAANANTATATGSEAHTWPVTLTAATASTSASLGWSPIFPQHTALQTRKLSTRSSSGMSLSTMSGTQRQDTCLDVTYTVPSFMHTDKESRKQPSSFNTHLPSYTLWHGSEHIEMCHLPPVSVVNSDIQLLPIHGRGLYSGNEAGLITNTLTSPPLHHHPMYSNQQAAIYHTGEKQATFETPFSLPRLPLTSQVLNFSGSSLETISPAVRAISSDTYHDQSLHYMPIRTMPTDEDGRHSQNISQPRSVPRSTNVKRPSKYPKHLKHNATSLCVGYPASQSSALSQSVPGDVPTYLPTSPFVGSSLEHSVHSSSEYSARVSFGSVFGSCSLQHRLGGEFPKSLSVAMTTDPQTTVSLANQRHNFGIGAFISDLSSNSLQVVTAPATIRRLDFPAPTVHVLQQQVCTSEHYQPQMECNQSYLLASDHASNNFALHNMSINSLLGDNPYPGFTPRYEAYSDTANHSTSVLPAFDVPTLNFSIRSQTPAVNFDRSHNSKARHT